MANDTVHIKDLLVRTIIGINPEERTNRQDVVINITMHTDVSEAAATDDIDATVNYRSVAKQVIALVEQSKFLLGERMAVEIADLCLAVPRVERAVVSVEKPGAVRFARSVGVTVDRGRGG